MTVDDYFDGPETMYPMELVHGIVREPPAPLYGHQSIVTRAIVVLDRHVREHRLGVVCVSPVDVVLDRAGGLVVQPDLVFVSTPRLHIIRDRIWGAPDLVVEVLSRSTAARDATEKLDWYRHYGVQECWLVDPPARSIRVVDCQSTTAESPTRTDTAVIASRVLPGLNVLVQELFD